MPMLHLSAQRPVTGLTKRFIHLRPILVCGMPRTGTSWIARTLSHSGNVRYLREPICQAEYAKSAGIPWLNYLRAGDSAPAYEEAWRRTLSMDVLVRHRWIVSQTPSWIRRAPFWPARLLIKEVACPLALEWVSDLFDLMVVVTIRHPCGYVASNLRLKEKGDPVPDIRHVLAQPALLEEFSAEDREWMAGLEDPIARMAAVYGVVYRIIGDQMTRHPEWSVVSHEALCRDPAGGFRRICKRLGLHCGNRLRTFIAESGRGRDDVDPYSLRRATAAEPEKWTTELTPEQIETIASVVSRFRLPFYRDFA